MKWRLTNPDLPIPVGDYDDLDAARLAAVQHMRDLATKAEAPLEIVLMYASFIYDENNWVKDPFGSTLYCNCSTRLHKMAENVIGDLSFFAEPV